MPRSIKLFFSYSHKDEELRDQLAAHLASLKRQKVIEAWHDRRIVPGENWAEDIDNNLNSADIVLLLISPDFLNSPYCSETELNQAMKRHQAGKACIIPVILRHSDWTYEPYAKFQALPKNAKPIVTWSDRDEAFLDVVCGIRSAVQALLMKSAEAEAEQVTEELTTEIKTSGQGEEQYRDEVLFCLQQDGGEISEVSRVILQSLQENLELPLDRAKAIETEVARPFQIFRKAVNDLNVQSITPAIQARLDRLQHSLKLTAEDATAIVESVLVPLNSVEPAIVAPSLPTFRFEIVTVNSRGNELDRRSGEASYYREELENDIFLDMVSIPSGTFWMGTVSDEFTGEADTSASRSYLEWIQSEKPQHQVTIEPFFMSKFTITQAQWRAVARLPQVNYALKIDPSKFKGDDRPVESVSWNEAIEFCERLSRKAGKQYRLPSEAEWEYACRAGTTTPFHFGETITPQLVNYNGNYVYANAAKGLNREQTIAVTELLPNAFGLYQMHGNVAEWCADPLHRNYQQAPENGRVWESNAEDTIRVIRGGSWCDDPRNCRSAFRNGSKRNEFSYDCGFRLALTPQSSD